MGVLVEEEVVVGMVVKGLGVVGERELEKVGGEYVVREIEGFQGLCGVEWG